MSSRRRNSPWRDLADTIAGQVNDALTQARDSKRGPASGWSSAPRRPPPADRPARDEPTSPYLSWDDERAEYPQERPTAGSRDVRSSRPPEYVPTRITSSDLSTQLRGLLSETVGTATESMRQRRADKKRLEPLRRARGRAVRAKVAAGAFGVATLVFGAAGIGTAIDGDAGAAAVGGVLTVAGGVGTVRSGSRARKYTKIVDSYETQLAGPTDVSGALGRRRSAAPAPTTVRALPPRSSAAYEPIRRLAAQEQVLTQMLPEILPVAPDIGAIADESERSLEQLAGRIVLLENAVAAASEEADEDFDGLRTSLRRMVDRLSDGVSAHERLIANAASVLAEMSGPTPGPTPVSGLRDAADGLQALAIGMREVSRPTQHLTDQPGRTHPETRPSAVDDVPDYGAPRRSSERPADRDRGH